jgi:hypothetical protein
MSGKYDGDTTRIYGIAGEVFVHFMRPTPRQPRIID